MLLGVAAYICSHGIIRADKVYAIIGNEHVRRAAISACIIFSSSFDIRCWWEVAEKVPGQLFGTQCLHHNVMLRNVSTIALLADSGRIQRVILLWGWICELVSSIGFSVIHGTYVCVIAYIIPQWLNCLLFGYSVFQVACLDWIFAEVALTEDLLQDGCLAYSVHLLLLLIPMRIDGLQTLF